MKRLLSISLLFLVLLASSRLTVSAHYCAGDLVSLEFFKTNKGCGKCGSTQKKHPCCKDVTSSVTSNDFNNITVDFEFSQSFVCLPALPIPFDFHRNEVVRDITRHSYQSNAPPLTAKEPKYILFSSLII